MKTIFIWLLRKYAGTEKGRVQIMRLMDEKVSDNYSEQTTYGNVYNFFIEFVMANPFVVKCALAKDADSLKILKGGIDKAFDKAVGYIENETPKH